MIVLVAEGVCLHIKTTIFKTKIICYYEKFYRQGKTRKTTLYSRCY